MEQDTRGSDVHSGNDGKAEGVASDEGGAVNSYAGDSPSKKIARALLYHIVKLNIADRVGKQSTQAIILAGDEGAETGPLRALLKWPSKLITVADFHEAGLLKVKSRYPEINTHHGDVRGAIKNASKVGFFHFDLCGHINSDACEVLRLAAAKMPVGGVLAVTIARGRESARSFVNSKYVKSCLSENASLDMQRLTQLVIALPEDFLKTVSIKYLGHSHPMVIHMFRRMGPFKKQRISPSGREQVSIAATDIGKQSMEAVKAQVLSWPTPLASSELGELFNLPSSTVAAWKAHATRGSYKESK